MHATANSITQSSPATGFSCVPEQAHVSVTGPVGEFANARTKPPPPVRVTFSSPTLTADFVLPPAAAMRLGRVILDTMFEHLPNGKRSDRP